MSVPSTKSSYTRNSSVKQFYFKTTRVDKFDYFVRRSDDDWIEKLILGKTL